MRATKRVLLLCLVLLTVLGGDTLNIHAQSGSITQPSGGGGGGGGSITLPVSSTDNALVSWDGVDGNTVQNTSLVSTTGSNLYVPNALTSGVASNAASAPFQVRDGSPGGNINDANAVAIFESDNSGTDVWINAWSASSVARLAFAKAGSPKYGLTWNDAGDYIALTNEVSEDTPDEGLIVRDYGGTPRVGINTNAPAQRLELSGNVLTARMNASNFSSKVGIGDADGDMNVGEGGTWTQYNSTSDNDQSIQWITHHSGVGQAIRMTLDRDGFLGLGTQTPSHQLHLTGSARINGSLGLNISPAQKIELETGGNISLGRIGQGAFTGRVGTGGSDGAMGLGVTGGSWIQFTQSSGDDNSIEFITHHSASSHAQRMVIDRDGNVGINQASPSYRLDVTGAARITSNVTVEGRVLGASSSITAANDLTLGATNFNIVSGNTQVNAITTTGWTAGSVCYLLFTGTPTVKHNTSGGGSTAPILQDGSTDLNATAGMLVTAIYDGTNWHMAPVKTP